MNSRFHIRKADAESVGVLQQRMGLPRFVAATLVARGYRTVEDAAAFLTPSLERDWRDPYEIPGLAQAADALERAVRSCKHILVFGDFDLDGISATTVLTRGLRALGARVTPFVPKRFDEGYGLSEAALARALGCKPDVVVTVDCGIACKNEAHLVTDAGVQLIVTDHHEPMNLVPEGIPVADPKLDSACESGILAGVGVALKLVQVLGGRLGVPYLWHDFLDFATLGTVADLMPMRGENRALVAEGIRIINTAPRPCLAALLATSGANDKPVTASNLSYSLVPRLNAAGRMGDAQLALDLLLADNFDECMRLATRLESVNDERRRIEAELSVEAPAQAAEVYHGQRALVVAGAGWHEGVKGIVASRLVGTYGVPTLLFSIEDGEARGSGRSVGRVNLLAAVESAAAFTTRFGGHEAAVGVTLPAENLPAFTETLCAYMDTLPEDDFHPLIQIDTQIDLDELNLQTVAFIDRLAPFGQENPVPCVLARNVSLAGCRAVGAEKNHLSCMLSNGRVSVAAIMFHCADIAELMNTDSVVNAAFELQIDEWRGRKTVKAMLKALSPTHACGALEACLDPKEVDFVADLCADGDKTVAAAARPSAEEADEREIARAMGRACWEARARQNPAALEEAVIRAIIGERPLHPSQRAILDACKARQSILAVMATGRGKSLTFQVSAACRALLAHEASLFVYPLRALISDQAFHLTEALAPFGISVRVLSGESTPEERAENFAGLRDGGVDIVLTTPEFLVCHGDEFARCQRIGFVVIDEAHHVEQAKSGQRVAYGQIGQVLSRLNNPTVLALTATASEAVAADISAALPVRDRVVDATSRTNLRVDDQRNVRNRDDYLARIVARGEKTVVYVNSREQSVAVARMLRRRVPQAATMVGFYNAGLTREERKRIEQLFRTGQLLCLVATSAFGEGVDIPDIRHVVLYHLPFNEIEFNQMSGRAGRDGQPATIHLLFSNSDASINDGILRDITPDHDTLAQVYRRLRQMQREAGVGFFSVPSVDLARLASTDRRTVSPASAACGVAVFRELGLIETRASYSAAGEQLFIRVNEHAAHVQLTDSVRYREGLGDLDVFCAFRDWVMHSDAATLHVRLSGPITPDYRQGSDQL